MCLRFFPRKILLLAPGVFLALFLLLSTPGATFAQSSHMEGFYAQTNLVSDLPNTAMFTDPNLINPWGLTHSAASPWWVSDNNSGFSTLYTGQGNAVPLVVTIPAPAGSPAGTVATPTGTV